MQNTSTLNISSWGCHMYYSIKLQSTWEMGITVYPKKYALGFVVLCFVVVMQSFIMNSHEVFIHIHQGCFADTGAIVRLPQCQWNKPDGYGKISQCITTTKYSKAITVCIFLGIYCSWHLIRGCLVKITSQKTYLMKQALIEAMRVMICNVILTHWGRVTHICVSKLTIIGSDNGLSPDRRQSIIWTNAGLLLIGPLGTNFSEILSEIHAFSFKKMHLKMSSAKWRLFSLGHNELKG